MANVDAPRGLQVVGTRSGGTFSNRVQKFYVPASDSTAFGIGHAVKLAGSADATGKYPSVTKASSTNAVVGVVVGIEKGFPQTTTPDLETVYRKASTETYVFVNTDPGVIMAIQEDSDGGALAVTDIGLNANWIDAGTNTTTGAALMEIDSSTKATTATLDFQLLRLHPIANNALGTNAIWEVTFNNHQFVDGTTGV